MQAEKDRIGMGPVRINSRRQTDHDEPFFPKGLAVHVLVWSCPMSMGWPWKSRHQKKE